MLTRAVGRNPTRNQGTGHGTFGRRAVCGRPAPLATATASTGNDRIGRLLRSAGRAPQGRAYVRREPGLTRAAR
ncbi:hypothetical protein GCM10010424_54440 [Streptomyces lienomycini]